MSTSSNSFSIFEGKKVLVTGHTGFKGSWLSQWLIQKGAELSGISKDIPTQPALFESLNLDQHMEHMILDIRDLENLRETIKRIKPDFIFHLAAQPIVSVSYDDPLGTFSSNAMGTAHILESVRSLDHKCVLVMITSDKCYENVEWVWGYKETDMLGGKDIYSGSKAAAEIIIHSYYHSFIKKMPNIRLASVRAGNVIGGGDWALNRIVPDCMRSWSKKEKVLIRSPHATRPWQHVLEPLSGYLNIAMDLWQRDKFNGESYNFGPPSENSITVLELLSKLSVRWGYDDPEAAFNIEGPSKFHEAGLLKLNCDKALFDLNWLPTLNLEELINFTGDWYYMFDQSPEDTQSFTEQQIREYEHKAELKSIPWSMLDKSKSLI
ncbi:CDP-glucose 4,6-dehydratase [Pararhodonellum marinum]|uniref:CDP-glucose 4,6-dehydratase n=1 Tax=Pararhodonellum marinum TaxID=2755358 RepID=UPI001890A88D|nr:CDP-glucose 4,6-dehydratase [Pararhodonellum marinum]